MTNRKFSRCCSLFAVQFSLASAIWFPAGRAVGAEQPSEPPKLPLTITADKLDFESTLKGLPQDEQRRVKKLFELVEDKDTDSGKALVVRLDKKRVREADFTFFTTEPVPLRVGLYRLTVRMKMIGMLNVLGTPIFVDAAGTRKEFRGYQFNAEDEYQEFPIEFEIIEPDVICSRPEIYQPQSPFGAAPSSWKKFEADLDAKRRHELGQYTEEEVKKRDTLIAQARQQKPKFTFSMGFSQTKRVVAGAQDTPENSIHSVTIDYLKVETVAEPPIRVRQVLADKCWLIPGQETSFRVWLGNRSGTDQTAELNLYLEHGLDAREKIASRKVTLGSGMYAVERFAYKTAPTQPLWGYAVVAEAVQDGKVISRERDVFSVHPNNAAVKNFGGPGPISYKNHVEVFGVCPGDCAKVCLFDLETPYSTGMSGYITNHRSQRAAADWNHEIGVAMVMYLFPGYDNNWGADLYLRHPEWFCSRLNFSDQGYALNEELDRVARELYAKDGSQPDRKTYPGFHIEGPLSFHDPRLLEDVVKGVIWMMKEVHYDGIRWDGGPCPVYEYNVFGERVVGSRKEAMELCAKNFAYMKQKVKEAGVPHFYNGFNGDSYGYTGIIHSLTAKQVEPTEFPQFVEMMKDGGWLMDESYAGACGFTDPLNIIRDYYRALVQMRTACRKVGGHFESFPVNWRGALLTGTDIYWYILTITAGAHIPAAYPPVPYSEDGLAHFATRFSEFFWDEALEPLPKAAEVIRVESPREIWYTEAAVQKRTADGCRYVIPLVNPPPIERFLKFRFGELPEPIREPFQVTVKRPAGFDGKAQVAMLTAEPRTEAIRLEAKADAGAVKFQVPDLKLFRILVVEFFK